MSVGYGTGHRLSSGKRVSKLQLWAKSVTSLFLRSPQAKNIFPVLNDFLKSQEQYFGICENYKIQISVSISSFISTRSHSSLMYCKWLPSCYNSRVEYLHQRWPCGTHSLKYLLSGPLQKMLACLQASSTHSPQKNLNCWLYGHVNRQLSLSKIIHYIQMRTKMLPPFLKTLSSQGFLDMKFSYFCNDSSVFFANSYILLESIFKY